MSTEKIYYGVYNLLVGSENYKKFIDIKIDSLGNYRTTLSNNQQQEIDLFISESFTDISSFGMYPGYLELENPISFCEAAIAGGFTQVGLSPSGTPLPTTQAQLVQLKQEYSKISIEPYVYWSTENKNLAEIGLLKNSYLAISNGINPLPAINELKNLFNYAQGIEAPIFLNLNLQSFSKYKIIEDETHLTLGLQGLPRYEIINATEEVLKLADYFKVRLHIHKISIAEQIELIKKYKSIGANISCDTGIENICFDDSFLENFDTSYYFQSVLGTKKDRILLKEALLAGDIDGISCNHLPVHKDYKKIEFMNAMPGMISLQTAFNMLLDELGEKFLPEVINILSLRNQKILGKPSNGIIIGSTKVKWLYSEQNNRSVSENSPLLHQNLKGRILVTMLNNGCTYFLE
jgi:dihydroorotase